MSERRRYIPGVSLKLALVHPDLDRLITSMKDVIDQYNIPIEYTTTKRYYSYIDKKKDEVCKAILLMDDDCFRNPSLSTIITIKLLQHLLFGLNSNANDEYMAYHVSDTLHIITNESLYSNSFMINCERKISEYEYSPIWTINYKCTENCKVQFHLYFDDLPTIGGTEK